MSRIPEVRALCLRVRRPLARSMIAGVLILPVLLGAGQYMRSTRPEVVVVEAEAARELAIEEAARSAIQEAWRVKTLERERQRLSLRFADEFRIPLSLAHEIHVAALEHGIDPSLAFRLVRAESRFRPRAVSPVGAVGLTQLMPSTARWLAPETRLAQLFDPRVNLEVGFRYLRMLLDEYGDAQLALTAYNRGPGTVNRLLRRGLDPDNGYTEFVLTGDATRHAAQVRARRRAAEPDPAGTNAAGS